MKALQSEGDLVRQFNAELGRASEFCFGMALVTKSGLNLIRPSIDRCLGRGGRGRVLFGVDLPTEPAAIDVLCEIKAQHRRNFELRRFQPGKRFFHPKFSIFCGKGGKRTAIIGSSNLTGEGLDANYETNVLLDDERVVRQFLDYFEEHFQGAHAKPVDEFWLDQYTHLWTKRKRAEERQRRLREKTRTLGKPSANIPHHLRGHVFAFTGAIADWPRESRLYPYILKRGGHFARSADSMAGAECLVHGDILGGRKTTKKLKAAREHNIPIITEEQFLKLAGIR